MALHVFVNGEEVTDVVLHEDEAARDDRTRNAREATAYWALVVAAAFIAGGMASTDSLLAFGVALSAGVFGALGALSASGWKAE